MKGSEGERRKDAAGLMDVPHSHSQTAGHTDALSFSARRPCTHKNHFHGYSCPVETGFVFFSSTTAPLAESACTLG